MMINKIHLGDSLKILKQIPDNSVDLIVTDPPYELSVGGRANRGVLKGFNTLAGEDIKKIVNGFDYQNYFKEFSRVLKRFHLFMFCSNKQLSVLLNIANEYNLTYTVLIWNKYNAAPFTSNSWKNDIEYIIHFKEKGISFKGDNKVYTHPMEVSKYGHPTEKPLKLIEKYIKIGSNENDVVLDPFLGSGTTVNACINLKRQYIGIEIDKKYYKIACEREQKAKGEWGLFVTKEQR